MGSQREFDTVLNQRAHEALIRSLIEESASGGGGGESGTGFVHITDQANPPVSDVPLLTYGEGPPADPDFLICIGSVYVDVLDSFAEGQTANFYVQTADPTGYFGTPWYRVPFEAAINGGQQLYATTLDGAAAGFSVGVGPAWSVGEVDYPSGAAGGISGEAVGGNVGFQYSTSSDDSTIVEPHAWFYVNDLRLITLKEGHAEVVDPTADDDITNKRYVDSVAAGGGGGAAAFILNISDNIPVDGSPMNFEVDPNCYITSMVMTFPSTEGFTTDESADNDADFYFAFNGPTGDEASIFVESGVADSMGAVGRMFTFDSAPHFASPMLYTGETGAMQVTWLRKDGEPLAGDRVTGFGRVIMVVIPGPTIPE